MHVLRPADAVPFTMSDAALLAAIRAAPKDDAPRLVYADWLDERGQPEWAEFIRVQCELARREQLQSHTGDDIVALWHREDELLAKHYESITGLKDPNRRLVFSRGFASRFRDITFFAGRRPGRAGTWTHLLFRFESTVRRIQSTCSAGDLVARAQEAQRFHSRDSLREGGWLLDWVGADFFQQNACTISDTRYVIDGFEYPPTVSVLGAEYRLASDWVQLHLDPIEAPYSPDPAISGFDAFPET